MTIARPLKLTPELIEEIACKIEIGHFPVSVCNSCGIVVDTYESWLAEGERENGRPILRKFYARVQLALAVAEQNHLDRWLKAGEKDWRASETFLAKRFPERWGARGSTTVEFLKLQLEEQRLKVAKLQAEIEALRGAPDEGGNPAYVEALEKAADEVWGPETSGT